MAPSSAKRANNVDLEAVVRRDADAPGDILPLDVRGTARPAIQRQKEAYAAKARHLGEELVRKQDRHGTLDEEVGELKAEIDAGEKKLAALEVQHDKLKGEIDAEARPPAEPQPPHTTRSAPTPRRPALPGRPCPRRRAPPAAARRCGSTRARWSG